MQSLIDLFAAHPRLALGAVFTAALLESFAVVGTLVPGSTIVFAGGVLVGLHALAPWPAAAAAVAGAVLGDGISYWLGRRYHAALLGMWPLARYPSLFERGSAYFDAHGGKSVFLGRFLGPVRAIVPLVAGMSNMPAARFYALNVLSACGWVAAHLLPGALFGASLQLAGAVSSRLVVLLALVLVAAWLIAAAVRLALRRGLPRLARLRERILLRANVASGPLARIALPLLDPARREPVALLVFATLLVGGAWLFLGVVEDVVTNDALVEVDRSIYEGLQRLRTGWGDDAMVTITELGSAYVMIPLIAAIALWLAIGRRWRSLAYWIGAAAFAQILVETLKYAIGRARPDTPYAAVDEFSFPSGHAGLSLVVYGFLAFLLGRGKPRWQQSGLALAAAGIALLVGLSRLYLGAHWFSDVLASFGLGLAWIALLGIAHLHHVREPPMRATPVLLIVLATLGLVGGTYAGNHHDRDLARYAKPPATRELRFDAWRDGQWRALPAFRAEIGGESEEPFSIQWIGTREALAESLATAGWRPPPSWKSAASLLWLAPSTPIGELPVLPKFNQGQAPELTFVRPLDARSRLVIRLWRMADITGGDGASPATPLWVGMITAERSRSELGLIETARTAAGVVLPGEALPTALPRMHSVVVARSSGGAVLLAW